MVSWDEHPDGHPRCYECGSRITPQNPAVDGSWCADCTYGPQEIIAERPAWMDPENCPKHLEQRARAVKWLREHGFNA